VTDAPSPAEPRDAAEIGFAAARVEWAQAARPVLVEAAGRYRALVRLKQLSEQVQQDTGITTSRPPARWIGEVLEAVAEDCASRGEPLLSSLCVSMQGSVGDSYAVAVERIRGARPEDPDEHAAAERLECYRHWEAVGLPRDGGTPLRTAHFTPVRRPATRPVVPKRPAAARTTTSRASTAKPAVEPKPDRLCPTCFTVVPASGICDFCD
jgi:hypothetical protein